MWYPATLIVSVLYDKVLKYLSVKLLPPDQHTGGECTGLRVKMLTTNLKKYLKKIIETQCVFTEAVLRWIMHKHTACQNVSLDVQLEPNTTEVRGCTDGPNQK